jgi:hypothetical protein
VDRKCGIYVRKEGKKWSGSKEYLQEKKEESCRQDERDIHGKRTGSEGYSRKRGSRKRDRKWIRSTGCRKSRRKVDRKCRIVVGKKIGREAYRKGGLSL